MSMDNINEVNNKTNNVISETKGKKIIQLSFLIAIIGSIMILSAFFLPTLSAKGKAREGMDALGDMKTMESTELTYKQIKDVNIIDFGIMYIQGSEEMWGDKETGYIYLAVFGCIGLFSLLTFIGVLRKKTVSTIIFTLFVFAGTYIFNKDLLSRHVMPSNTYNWGIARYMYVLGMLMVIVGAIWMALDKKKL